MAKRRRSTIRRFVTFFTCSSLVLAGCTSSGDVGRVGVVTPPSYTCDDVVIERSSGRPTNPIGVSVVPSSFGAFPAFEVLDVERGEEFVVPVAGTAGQAGAYFIVPVLPASPVVGGQVQLTLNDGDGESCEPVDFTIEELPEAPGAFAELTEEVGRLHTQTTQLFEPWFPEASDGETTDMTLPLELAEDWLAGEENPNSIERVTEGTAEISDLITPEAERLMDGLVAESGVLDEIAAVTDEVTEIADPPSDLPEPPQKQGPDGGAEGSTGFCAGVGENMSAQMLSFLMNGQGKVESFRDSTDLLLDGIGLLNGVVGVLSLAATGGVPNPVTAASGAVGVTLSAYDLLADMTEHILPSELGTLDFDYDRATYLEDDEDLSGYWENVTVTAVNKEWNLDGRILEIVLKRATGGVSKAFFERHTADALVEGTAKFLRETFVSAGTRAAMAHREEGAGLITIPSCEFGPVDISDPEFHWAEFVPSGEPALIDGDTSYVVVTTGVGNLVVRAQGEKFNGSQAMLKQPVDAEPIKVTIDPPYADGDPGFTATFTVTVHHANDPSVDITLEPVGGHVLSHEQVADNVYQVTVATSEQREDFPARLRVESTSSTGLRALADAPPRVGAALIRSGGDIVLSPWATCVEPGETTRFSAVVHGFDNQGVSWTASGGSITADGQFTAPDQEGTYEVQATADADSTRTATARVTVAETCQCWAAFELPRRGLVETADSGSITFGEEAIAGRLYTMQWALENGSDIVLDFYLSAPSAAKGGPPPLFRGDLDVPHDGPRLGETGQYLVSMSNGVFEPSGSVPQLIGAHPSAVPLGHERYDLGTSADSVPLGYDTYLRVEEFTALSDSEAWLEGALSGTVLVQEHGDVHALEPVRMALQGRFVHDPAEDLFPGITGSMFDSWYCGAD